MTPLQFVQTYLVGTGVTVTNATFNGSSEPLNSTNRTPPATRDQIGSFATTGGALGQIGIAGGVILSSGYTQMAIAPNNPSGTMNNPSPGGSDPDLVILAGTTVNDKAVLEFDFVPQTELVTFRYVFASLEFDQFCPPGYNDAFGLFLSGPGIAGGAGFANNAVNIAQLPESVAPVNIYNICSADKNNLGNGLYSWWNGSLTYFSYHRLTYVLTASHSVTCNQTYHMKFAIGDAGDMGWDSGVFLEQNSFSSNSVVGSTTFSNPLTGQFLVEGCGNASLSYSIPQLMSTPLTITLYIDPASTASQADILPNPFPTEVVIPTGSLQSTPILLSAVQDGLTEPDESLIIDATTTSCSTINTTQTTYNLKDKATLSVVLANQTACNGSPVILTPTVTGGQPILPVNTLNYLWSTGATTSSISVNPPIPTNYSITVTDACGQAGIATALVSTGTIPVATGSITGQATICTPATGITYTVPVITGADSYVWAVPTGATITAGSTTNTITVDYGTSAVSGAVTVKGVNTVCGPGLPVSLPVSVAPSPQPAGAITGSAGICVPVSGVTYSVPDIVGATSYQWTVPSGATITSGSNTNTITVDYSSSAISGDVTVKALSTLCGSGQPSSLAVTVHPTPEAAGTLTGEDTLCAPAAGIVYSVPAILGATSYSWTVPPGATITAGNNTNSITVGYGPAASSGSYTVTGQSAFCGNGPSSALSVTVNPAPQAAGTITGLTNICTPATSVPYSVPAVYGATSYVWTLPPGATIGSGNNTNSVTVDFDLSATSGTVTVMPHSTSCGDGQSSSLALSIHPSPQAAGTISGPGTLCTPTTATYSVPAITGADSFIWTLPSGITVTAGAGTNTITVDVSTSATSGNITVTPHSNSCGNGTPATLALVIHPSPAAAGTITGPSPVCQGSPVCTYSVPAIAYATSYDWSVPTGVTILSGSGTTQITCVFTTSAVSGNFSVKGWNADCGYGTSSVKPVVVNPLPAPAGVITSATGQTVCQRTSAVQYTVTPIAHAATYTWSYSGSGATLTNNGATLLIDFSATATSGTLKVKGENGCGEGIESPLFAVTVNPIPTAEFQECNDLKTTKNGRPVLLRGGRPMGSGGVYSGTGVRQVSPGTYVFDPTLPEVSGGGIAGINYTITYRYTNTYNCPDQKTRLITVFSSNAADPCPGTVKDCRDNQTYPTFLVGSGVSAKCWMSANLNYGTSMPWKSSQTDNCLTEKYCINDQTDQCNDFGGFYQWDELMQYQGASTFQDFCPPGWHVATGPEWDQLISASLGAGIAGSMLKDTVTSNGFKGFLKGLIYLNNTWSFTTGDKTGSMFWTADKVNEDYAVARGLNSINFSVSLYPSSRANAFPVRCVRNY